MDENNSEELKPEIITPEIKPEEPEQAEPKEPMQAEIKPEDPAQAEVKPEEPVNVEVKPVTKKGKKQKVKNTVAGGFATFFMVIAIISFALGLFASFAFVFVLLIYLILILLIIVTLFTILAQDNFRQIMDGGMEEFVALLYSIIPYFIGISVLCSAISITLLALSKNAKHRKGGIITNIVFISLNAIILILFLIGIFKVSTM